MHRDQSTLHRHFPFSVDNRVTPQQTDSKEGTVGLVVLVQSQSASSSVRPLASRALDSASHRLERHPWEARGRSQAAFIVDTLWRLLIDSLVA